MVKSDKKRQKTSHIYQMAMEEASKPKDLGLRKFMIFGKF